MAISMLTENLATANGWFMVSVVYAIIAVDAMLLVFIFCKERHHLIEENAEEIREQLEHKQKEKGSIIEDLKILLNKRHFWTLLLITLCKFAATGFFMQFIGWFVEAYAPNLPLIYFGGLLVGIGGANMTLVFPLIGDVVEYVEQREGRTLAGLTNSGYSIGNKIGMGLGGAMVGWILTFSGYVGTAEVQTASALGGVRFLFGAVPAIVSLIAGLAW